MYNNLYIILNVIEIEFKNEIKGTDYYKKVNPKY